MRVIRSITVASGGPTMRLARSSRSGSPSRITALLLSGTVLWTMVLSGMAATAVTGAVAGASPVAHSLPSPVSDAFWLVTPGGPVEAFGVPDLGSPAGPLNQPLVAAEPTGDRGGYWLVASDGGVFAYGNARYYGSTGGMILNQPIVGMASTTDGRGYWLVARDGGIFSFGDAGFYGSTGGMILNQPVVAMAPSPDGRGYWLVAADGGVFAFGDAGFYGSTGDLTLDQPIVGLAPSPDGRGYWLVAADGGVFAFGDAGFYGSAAGATGEPVERLVTTRDGRGYWVFSQNGTAEAFGDAAGRTPSAQTLVFEPVTPGDQAVLFAFQQLGKPYIWGGNGPVGYDCSGLALASWTHGAGITFARVADDQYETAGVPVALAQLQAGDLVFWGTDPTEWTSVYHTAIYVGGNRIVESTGTEVQLNSIDQWGLDQLMPNGRRP